MTIFFYPFIAALSILWLSSSPKHRWPLNLQFSPLWPNHFQPHVMKISGSPLWESLSSSGGHFGDSVLARLTTQGNRKPPSPLATYIPLSNYYFAHLVKAGLQLVSQRISLHRATPPACTCWGLPGPTVQGEHHTCSSPPASPLSMSAGLESHGMETWFLLARAG